MRRVVHGVDPMVPIGEVTALDDRIAELLMPQRALLSLAGGLSAGIVGAVAFGRLASRFLYGIEPTDPAWFAVAAAVLGLVTGVAAFVPAWRAARMDPASIFKAE